MDVLYVLLKMNSRKEQLSARQLQKIILGMFLAGLPFGGIAIYGLVKEPSDWMIVVFFPGCLIWVSWLFRFFFSDMPRKFRILIWSASAAWHALLMPFCIMGMIVWVGWYFAIHCFVMLAFSLKLITGDRPDKHGIGEQGVVDRRAARHAVHQ